MMANGSAGEPRLGIQFDFALDMDAVEQGIWREYAQFAPGFRIRVRGWRSKAYRAGLQKRFGAIAAKNLSEEDQLEARSNAVLEATAKACIVEWEGAKTKAGHEIPCNYSNALHLLTDSATDHVAALILSDCQHMGERGLGFGEGVMGKSGKESARKSSRRRSRKTSARSSRKSASSRSSAD